MLFQKNQSNQANNSCLVQSLSCQNCENSCFQNKFETIRSFVEELKQPSIQITAKEDLDILKYIDQSFRFLETEKSLESPKLFRNALVSLGNLLSIKYSFFRKQFLSQKFLSNMNKYFRILQKSQQEQNFNATIYPFFYLIVLVIYNSTREVAKILAKNLFTKQFIKTLSQLELQQGNKIERYLPVIVAFIVKNFKSGQNTSVLKETVIKNLHFSKIVKNQLQFIYSLRFLINQGSFSLNEIRRYSILEHLQSYLRDSQTEQNTTMILQVLKHILKRHQVLGYQMIKSSFLNILEKSHKLSPAETINLLQVLIPCLPLNYKEMMFSSHLQNLKRNKRQKHRIIDEKQISSLKIISLLLDQLNKQCVFEVIEATSIQRILNNACQATMQLQEDKSNTLIGFVGKVLSCVSRINKGVSSHLSSILRPFCENSRIKSLHDNHADEEPMFLE